MSKTKKIRYTLVGVWTLAVITIAILTPSTNTLFYEASLCTAPLLLILEPLLEPEKRDRLATYILFSLLGCGVLVWLKFFR